jgi:hypothetical protein
MASVLSTLRVTVVRTLGFLGSLLISRSPLRAGMRVRTIRRGFRILRVEVTLEVFIVVSLLVGRLLLSLTKEMLPVQLVLMQVAIKKLS